MKSLDDSNFACSIFVELQKAFDTHSVHPFCWGGGGVKSPTKFSKRGGLIGPPIWEGVAGKEGVTFFRGSCNFYKKNKLKSEIFNGKKRL